MPRDTLTVEQIVAVAIELPKLEATDWRTAATKLAAGLHGMLTRHPWQRTGDSGERLAHPAAGPEWTGS